MTRNGIIYFMISVVVPVYNEEKSLALLYQQIKKVLPKLGRKVEIIFADDGSTDSSLQIIKQLRLKNKDVKILSFRANQGKSEILMEAFSRAQGDYIVTLDADLQDKPSEIPQMVVKAKEGWDLVCGWRKIRRDSWLKVLSSRIFNSLTKLFWGVKLHDYNCGLKVYSRACAQSLILYGGLHRFIPLLAYQKGFSVTEVPVVHGKREFGKSKYGFSKIWKDIPDMFTMLFLSRYEKRPSHFFTFVGGMILVFGVLILFYLTIVHFLGESIGGRPLLFLGMLLMLSGFQILFTGFLADLILNQSYTNSKEDIYKLKHSSFD